MKIFLFLSVCFGFGAFCGAGVIYPQAPEGGQLLVHANVTEVLHSDPSFLGGVRVDELTFAAPFKNYGVGLGDLISGHLLSAAKSRGFWTYLLMHGSRAAGAGGLIADETSGKAKQANGLFQSNFSIQTLEALRLAKELPQVKKQDYEMRRLDIPGILFVAVWLHGKSDDIIIPLPPTFGRWDGYKVYSERQMLKLLAPVAEKKLQEPAGFGAPPGRG